MMLFRCRAVLAVTLKCCLAAGLCRKLWRFKPQVYGCRSRRSTGLRSRRRETRTYSPVSCSVFLALRYSSVKSTTTVKLAARSARLRSRNARRADSSWAMLSAKVASLGSTMSRSSL